MAQRMLNSDLMKKLSKKQKKKLNKMGRKVLKAAAGVTGLAAVFTAGVYGGKVKGFLASAGQNVTSRVKGLAGTLGVSKLANGISGKAHSDVEVAHS